MNVDIFNKKGKPIKTLTLNVNLYESLIASDLMLIQKNNPKCSIGSYPYFNYASKKGGVNIVVSSWELDDLTPIVKQITSMIKLFVWVSPVYFLITYCLLRTGDFIQPLI